MASVWSVPSSTIINQMDASVSRAQVDSARTPVSALARSSLDLSSCAAGADLLAAQEWSRESGVHEPLVIATGAWLIWRDLQDLKPLLKRGVPAITAAILIPSLAAYVFGGALDFLILEAVGLYGSWHSLRLRCRRWRRTEALVVSLLLSGVRPAGSGLAAGHGDCASQGACFLADTHLLQLFGVPVVREGVTLFVAQYQLLLKTLVRA